MTADTIGTVLYALVLAIGLVMAVRPSTLKAEFSSEKGTRLLGIIFVMVGAANLLDRFGGDGA